MFFGMSTEASLVYRFFGCVVLTSLDISRPVLQLLNFGSWERKKSSTRSVPPNTSTERFRIYWLHKSKRLMLSSFHLKNHKTKTNVVGYTASWGAWCIHIVKALYVQPESFFFSLSLSAIYADYVIIFIHITKYTIG